MSAENKQILISKDNGIMTITLNRPEKRNALNEDMCMGIEAAVEDAAMDGNIRIVVLRGAGQCFCAGIDFNMLAQINTRTPTSPSFRFYLEKLQHVFNSMEKLEKPVIALLHSFCYGMGTEMALAADFRIASDDMKIGIQEVELGLIPDVGGTTRMTRTVGIPMAKEMIMTGKVIDAAEAYRINLVNEVCPAGMIDETADRWVAKLRGCAPLAVGLAKKLIDRAAHLDKLSFMDMEGLAQTTLLRTEDVQEGVMARIQKRKPDFKGK